MRKQIEKFWLVEDISAKPLRSLSEEFCENHFLNNFKRNHNGQFVVKIPFNDKLKNLGESKELAINRFKALERKLLKNPNLQRNYSGFMREYEELGHMTEIKTMNDQNLYYFLPHHAVVRESSLTTKTRVVFDGSMKTSSGLSLNDVQHVGPTIQNELFSILLRFRKFQYVMTADISKMYRMILVNESDRPLQTIFWRENPVHDLKCYHLNTLTYGTASAPFLAIRCLNQLAQEHAKLYPLACNAIKTDFYVDDLLTGADTKDELLKLQRDISKILVSGGFHLRNG